MPCYKSGKLMMLMAHYKSGNDDDESDNNNKYDINDKSDNNENKICLLLKRWVWVGHILDHVLDQIIIGLVTTPLHLLFSLA